MGIDALDADLAAYEARGHSKKRKSRNAQDIPRATKKAK
jgi:hypothetical protein